MIYQPWPFRRCVKCGGEYLPTDKFFYRNGVFLRVECRACTKTYRDEVRRANKEKLNERNRELYRKNRHKEAARKAVARKKNPEKFREISRRSQRKHKITHQVDYHRYQTRKRQLPAIFTVKDWRRCADYFKGYCAVCGRPAGLWHTLAMDHWIPLSSPECPGTISTNIVPLCHGQDGCNNSKSSKGAVVWLTERYGPRKAKQILARVEAYFAWVREQDAEHPKE